VLGMERHLQVAGNIAESNINVNQKYECDIDRASVALNW
jgi:hypothetical protein